MEMWCPDDTGRGQLGLGWATKFGREHDSLPQSGMEAVKTDPHQIGLLLLLLMLFQLLLLLLLVCCWFVSVFSVVVGLCVFVCVCVCV